MVLGVICLGFVQLADHDVVTKLEGQIPVLCFLHLSVQGLPQGHSDLKQEVVEELVQDSSICLTTLELLASEEDQKFG